MEEVYLTLIITFNDKVITRKEALILRIIKYIPV